MISNIAAKQYSNTAVTLLDLMIRVMASRVTV